MSEEKKPFDFFQTPWFKDATSQLCADGWPMFVVPLNVKISECKDEYEKLKAENTKLQKKVSILTKALELYVGKMILEPNGVIDWSTVEEDGETARQALKDAESVK